MAGKRAPRVLMTADTVGGVWTYAVELARALAQRGVQVALATMGAPVAGHQRAALDGCRHVTVHESTWRLEWMQDAWADVDGAGRWLLALERELQPDVVHLNQFAFGALPFAAPTLLMAHSCVASWWRAVHGVSAPPEWDEYRRRVRAGLMGARRVTAPTRAMLQGLALDYAWRGNGRVLPNGCAPEAFHAGDKEPVVFAAGRFWDAAKNLGALEEVAPGLPWPIRVAGTAAHPDGGTLEPRGVQWLGELPRTEVAAELARAAIYALPARYEPFGLSALEAALSGCALVLGDIPSLREVWGTTARYVDPDRPAALRTALEQLISNPVERQRLGRAAHARARRYTAAAMCEATMVVYGHLSPVLAEARKEELLCA